MSAPRLGDQSESGLSPASRPAEVRDGPEIDGGQTTPASQSQRRVWLSAGAAALLAGVAVSAWKLQPREPEDEAVRTLFKQSFPVAAGPKRLSNSTPFALGALGGKTVMLNFWATWCPPCIEEMPELSKLAETWQRDFGTKVSTIGIGIDSIANIQKFYQTLPVSYDLLAANAQGLELIRLLGNPTGGLPFSLIINPQGAITERILGRFDGKKLDLSLRKAASGT
jgi:thiol-disulfide isomerase/thioredoxin